MSTTTARKLHRWSDEQEARRLGHVAAGLEPRLFHWWGSSSTDELREAVTEYASLDDIDADMAEVIDQLRLDIAYRTHHTVRPYVNVERYETAEEADARAAELCSAYAIPFVSFPSRSVGMFSVVVAP